ncbi:MAG: chemotaxis protein CheX [Clostridiales bacterium]|nr:chemotaxis protein CheX [Clostridiales bacterium]
MYAQFFGNYLLSHGVVTQEQLLQAMQKAATEKIKLGTLAIHAGYMTADEVERIIILQTHQDRRFGELAIQEGYLTEAEVSELLKAQQPDFLLLGQALVDGNMIDNKQLQDLIIRYQSENELSDFDYSADAKEQIDQLIEKFFVVAEHPLSDYEVPFLRLFLNNLIRFIGDDFTLAAPSLCKEYPRNYCVSQQIIGSCPMNTFLDMSQETAIAFASRYADELFTEFDEYVRSSLEDFLNLNNGLFTVNLSNEDSVELILTPPVTESPELLVFNVETYLLPIVYPFGTLYFLLEMTKNS